MLVMDFGMGIGATLLKAGRLRSQVESSHKLWGKTQFIRTVVKLLIYCHMFPYGNFSKNM